MGGFQGDLSLAHARIDELETRLAQPQKDIESHKTQSREWFRYLGAVWYWGWELVEVLSKFPAWSKSSEGKQEPPSSSSYTEAPSMEP